MRSSAVSVSNITASGKTLVYSEVFQHKYHVIIIGDMYIYTIKASLSYRAGGRVGRAYPN